MLSNKESSNFRQRKQDISRQVLHSCLSMRTWNGTYSNKILKMKDSSKKHTKKGNKRHKNTLHSVRSHAGNKKRSVLQSFKEKLQGSKFRWLNEVLYTRSGDEAMVLLRENPELYREYHQGFREQTKQWPERPVDKAIEWLSKRPEEWKVLDLGCGDAEISRRAKQENIQNFDLSSSAPNVTVCNIASLPLEDESVDAAIFCLSLMGTDYGSFIEEAMRVLKEKGWLWIAEVQSRCMDDQGNNLVHELIRAIEALGFDLRSKTVDQNSHFFTIVLQKKKNKKSKKKNLVVEWPVLKACTYKKR